MLIAEIARIIAWWAAGPIVVSAGRIGPAAVWAERPYVVPAEPGPEATERRIPDLGYRWVQ